MQLSSDVCAGLVVMQSDLWRAGYDQAKTRRRRKVDADDLADEVNDVRLALRNEWIAAMAQRLVDRLSVITLSRHFAWVQAQLACVDDDYARQVELEDEPEQDGEAVATMLAYLHYCRLADADQVGDLEHTFTPHEAQIWLGMPLATAHQVAVASTPTHETQLSLF